MADALDTMKLLTNEAFLADLKGSDTNRVLADRWGISTSTVSKYRSGNYSDRFAGVEVPGEVERFIPEEYEESSDGARTITNFAAIRDRPVNANDVREWLRSTGDDPATWNYSFRSIAYGGDKFSNKMSCWPKAGKGGDAPAWPVIQVAAPVSVKSRGSVAPIGQIDGLNIALKCADTQIGFRLLADGTLDPFHDDAAMSVFVETVRAYRPTKVTILGDFLDLPAQGRFAQEAAFARTTQLAINRGHQFLAELRSAAPDAEIIVIEGNHDLRMQNFIQNNALAAFGLKRAEMPDEWPVMSLPYLLRLEDLNIKYIDAYPAATDWDNATTRNIHGTKVNSKGSTTSQYVHELPHISTWAGHTHRCEITYHTVLGQFGDPIESYAANPGVLCRVDGAVPSVHGAIGADGVPARVVENWQQGFGILYYNETESWPSVHRIRDGVALVDGYRIAA